MTTSRERIPMSQVSSVIEYQELRALGNTHEAACRRIGVTVPAMEARIKRARERGDIPWDS